MITVFPCYYWAAGKVLACHRAFSDAIPAGSGWGPSLLLSAVLDMWSPLVSQERLPRSARVEVQLPT